MFGDIGASDVGDLPMSRLAKASVDCRCPLTNSGVWGLDGPKRAGVEGAVERLAHVEEQVDALDGGLVEDSCCFEGIEAPAGDLYAVGCMMRRGGTGRRGEGRAAMWRIIGLSMRSEGWIHIRPTTRLTGRGSLVQSICQRDISGERSIERRDRVLSSMCTSISKIHHIRTCWMEVWREGEGAKFQSR